MARWNRSLEFISRGVSETKETGYDQWFEGWRDYDYGRQLGMRPTRSPWPEWDGSPIAGRTLYIWQEQGIGDSIMLLRFVRHARQAAGPDAKIIVEMQADLLPLFNFVPGADQIVITHASGAFQCSDKDPVHASLFSLARILKITPGDIAKDAWPYPPGFTMREKKPDGLPLRVGVVWRGNKGHVNDARRSMNIENMRPIIDLHDDAEIQIVSLQYGETDDEKTVLMERHDLKTFHETACVIKTLDVVVGVDTGTLHLAGAMAANTMMLLSRNVDWRWGRTGNTTMWYPNHRLVRQESLNDWGPSIEFVKGVLLSMREEKAMK